MTALGLEARIERLEVALDHALDLQIGEFDRVLESLQPGAGQDGMAPVWNNATKHYTYVVPGSVGLAAGGDLAGAYPNPTLAVDRVRKVGDSMTGDLTFDNASGAVIGDVRLSRSAAKTLNVAGLVKATGGMATITKAGTIVDADITGTGVAAAVDGLLGVNTLRGQLQVRTGGLWLNFGRASVFNVREFGATGDGVSDDTVAVQAAVDAAAVAKGIVFFPAGTYLIGDAGIAITSSDTCLVGDGKWGTKIQQKLGATRPVIRRLTVSTRISNVLISNLMIVGNGIDARTTVSGTQVVGSGGNLNVVDGSKIKTSYLVFWYNGAPFSFTGVAGNTIQGVTPGATFTNALNVDQAGDKVGIYLALIDDLRISDCGVTNFYDAGIAVNGCKRFTIERNWIFDTCQISNVRNGLSIQDYNAGGGEGICDDFHVLHNHVEKGLTGGIVFTDNYSTAAAFRRRGEIKGNTVIDWLSWTGIAVEVGYAEDFDITGNHVYNCLNGIVASETESLYSNIAAPQNILITGNIIYAPNLDSLGRERDGISTTGSGIVITNNIVFVSGDCVLVGGATAPNVPNENIKIGGNHFTTVRSDVPGSKPTCIAIQSAGRAISIYDNHFDRYNVQAVGAQAGVTTLTVDTVTHADPAGGTIRVEGSASTVTYTSITQATRTTRATINGLSGAVTVTDGQLVFFGAQGHQVLVQNADDVKISDNYFSHFGQSGVCISTNTSRSVISDNYFDQGATERDTGSTLTSSGVALSNAGGNTDAQVFDNTFTDPNSRYNGIVVLGCPNTQLRGNYKDVGTSWLRITAGDVTMERDNRKSATHIPNGDLFSSTPGAVTVVNIAHGLLTTPKQLSVNPSNANARGLVNAGNSPAVTADNTNVILTFNAALTAATVYDWNWTASL